MDTTHHTETKIEPAASAHEVFEVRLPAGWTWGWVSFLAPGIAGGLFMTAGILQHVAEDPATKDFADFAYAAIIGFYETFLLCGLSGLLAFMLIRDSLRVLKRYGIIGDHLQAGASSSARAEEPAAGAESHSVSADGDGLKS